MVAIDSGPVEAGQRFCDVPKSKWKSLVNAKRYFLAVKVSYDCRCLVEFCEEAEVVWEELGYGSAAAMIREGYDLDPVEIELAVAWLKHNEPAKEIGIAAIQAKVAEASLKPMPKHGGDRNSEEAKEVRQSNQVDNVNLIKGGNATEYTLRRLARDAPELLGKIESGELSVNQAAIKAGIRKKPTPEEICVRAFNKCEDRTAMLDRLTRLIDDSIAEQD